MNNLPSGAEKPSPIFFNRIVTASSEEVICGRTLAKHSAAVQLATLTLSLPLFFSTGINRLRRNVLSVTSELFISHSTLMLPYNASGIFCYLEPSAPLLHASYNTGAHWSLSIRSGRASAEPARSLSPSPRESQRDTV